MFAYEIRFLTRNAATARTVATVFAGDFAAIRRARALASNGERAEVWRGADCIYADPPHAAAGAVEKGARHGL